MRASVASGKACTEYGRLCSASVGATNDVGRCAVRLPAAPRTGDAATARAGDAVVRVALTARGFGSARRRFGVPVSSSGRYSFSEASVSELEPEEPAPEVATLRIAGDDCSRSDRRGRRGSGCIVLLRCPPHAICLLPRRSIVLGRRGEPDVPASASRNVSRTSSLEV